MNIFKTIAGILGENDDVTIVVTKSAGGRLAVSTNFRNRSVTDKSRDLIAPFLVSGTPEELDAEYCGIIAEPLEQSSGIQTSMANFEASKKLAQAKSQQAAASKGKADNERLAAEKKARALYEEAKKLSDGKRHDEAARKLEEALKTASEADRKKIQDLLDKCKANKAPDIFGAFGDEDEEAPAETGTGTEPEGEPEADAPEETDTEEEEPIDIDPESFGE